MSDYQSDWENEVLSRIRPVQMPEELISQMALSMENEMWVGRLSRRVKPKQPDNLSNLAEAMNTVSKEDDEWASSLRGKISPAKLSEKQIQDFAQIMENEKWVKELTGKISPAPVSEVFLQKVENLDVESKLSELKPAPLGSEMLQKFAGAMQAESKSAESSRIIKFPWFKISSAAAVLAIAGIIVGQFNNSNPTSEIADNVIVPLSKEKTQEIRPEVQDTFSPNIGRNAVRVANEGVIWVEDKAPHQCMRVDYVDKVQVSKPDGSKVEVSKPATGYIYVPVDMD